MIGSPFPSQYPYNLRFNNCGHAFSRAVRENGYGIDIHIAPLAHLAYIETQLRPYIKERHHYPQTGYGPGFIDSAKKAIRDFGFSLVQGISKLYGEP